MEKTVGIYFDKGGGTRGGPYVRAKLLEKYIPYVKIFNDVKEAKNFSIIDFQWRLPKELNKYPHICTFHGVLPLKYCSNLYAKGAMFIRTWQQNKALQSAKAIIAVSEEALRQVKQRLPSSQDKIVKVIYAGLELHNYKIREKENKFLFLNSLEKYENLQVIIDALKHRQYHYGHYFGWSYYPKFFVDVYGYGRMQKHYEKQIDTFGLSINIKDEVDNKIIIDELLKARAVIQPALQETFGLPICEAMLSGAIAIASDIPSHRENFKNVLFFKTDDYKQLGNLIEEVINGKHDDLIKPALKEVKKKYNVERFINETKKVYQEVLNG
jgi:glycosyltransferase involved in cell wall biosynthesis